MEIKCLSLGNPNDGFKNYFLHNKCHEELEFHFITQSDLVEALRLSEWQDYTGNQVAGRFCCNCLEPLDAIQESSPESLPARESSDDSGEMGQGNANS